MATGYASEIFVSCLIGPEWFGSPKFRKLKSAMKAPANLQVINDAHGNPAFVVIPYQDYLRAYDREHDLTPHEVVKAVVYGSTPVRAWREYLKLTQAEVASRLGISQPSYAKQEASNSLRRKSLEKIAAALQISMAQLDF
jgi:DNA-binding XRE family transcriptional regulator